VYDGSLVVTQPGRWFGAAPRQEEVGHLKEALEEEVEHLKETPPTRASPPQIGRFRASQARRAAQQEASSKRKASSSKRKASSSYYKCSSRLI